MTLKQAPYYWLECDRCGVSSTEGDDFSAWKDSSTAYDLARGGEWDRISDKDFCAECLPVVRCLECEALYTDDNPKVADEPMCSSCASTEAAS